MDNFQKMDIADIDLEKGGIFGNYMLHSIGRADNQADIFGIRVFRGGVPVSLTGASVQGFFRDGAGNNIVITTGTTVSGNQATVTLPQACYNYEGNFSLAIKLIGGGVTGTMRMVYGVVDNTNTGSAVVPTGDVPSYQEILAQFDAMVEATAEAKTAAAIVNDRVRMFVENANFVDTPYEAKGWSTSTWTQYDATNRASTELMTLPNGFYEFSCQPGYKMRIVTYYDETYNMIGAYVYGIIKIFRGMQIALVVSKEVQGVDVDLTPDEALTKTYIRKWEPEEPKADSWIGVDGFGTDWWYKKTNEGNVITTSFSDVLGYTVRDNEQVTVPFKMPKSGMFVSQVYDKDVAVSSQPSHWILFYKLNSYGEFEPANDYEYANTDFTVSPPNPMMTRLGLYFPYAENLYCVVKVLGTVTLENQVRMTCGNVRANNGRVTNLAPVSIVQKSAQNPDPVYGTEYYPTFRLQANGTYVTEQFLYATIIRLQDARGISCSPKYSMSAWFYQEDGTWIADETIRGVSFSDKTITGVNHIDFEHVGKTGWAVVVVRSTMTATTPEAGGSTTIFNDPSMGVFGMYDDVVSNLFVEYYNGTIISHAHGMHPTLAKNIRAFKNMKFDRVMSFKYGGPVTSIRMRMDEMKNATLAFYAGRMYVNSPLQNMSAKSYATALKNFNSAVYRSDWTTGIEQYGFGYVCNNLPPVLFGYPWAARAASWYTEEAEYPGFTYHRNWDYMTEFDEIRVGDWLLGENPNNADAHVVLITDVIYINGEFVCFEVMESFPPTTRYRYFFVSEPLIRYNAEYSVNEPLGTYFDLLVHPDYSSIKTLSESFGSLETDYEVGTLMCDRGTDSVYTAHQEHCYITINDEEMSSFAVYKDGTPVDTVTLASATKVSFGDHPLKAVDIIDIIAANGSGYYTLVPNNKATAQESFYVAPDQTITTVPARNSESPQLNTVTVTPSNTDNVVYMIANYVPADSSVTNTNRCRITHIKSEMNNGSWVIDRHVTYMGDQYDYNWCEVIYKTDYGTYMVRLDGDSGNYCINSDGAFNWIE